MRHTFHPVSLLDKFTDILANLFLPFLFVLSKDFVSWICLLLFSKTISVSIAIIVTKPLRFSLQIGRSILDPCGSWLLYRHTFHSELSKDQVMVRTCICHLHLVSLTSKMASPNLLVFFSNSVNHSRLVRGIYRLYPMFWIVSAINGAITRPNESSSIVRVKEARSSNPRELPEAGKSNQSVL